MGLRPDLQQVLDDLDAADRAASDLTAPLSDEQFRWAPPGATSRGPRREGAAAAPGWSIAQCLDHLATANEVYGRAIRLAVDSARQAGRRGGGPIASTAFGRWFIASLEPPVKRRTRAPGKIAPRSTDSREEIMAAYYAAHDALRASLRDCAEIDVNRATFPNPFIPLVRMRVGTGLRVIAAHDRRHLWQARQVTLDPGFPSSPR